MRLEIAVSALGWLFVSSVAAIAAQPPSQQYRSGISRMFLDAHSPDQPKYGRSELKAMIRSANTPADFERLADYFDYRSLEFEQKAHDEATELQRLLSLPYHAKSWPIQLDGAREFVRRYRAQAEECTSRAAAYRERANAESKTK